MTRTHTCKEIGVEDNQNESVDRGRIVEDYKHSIIQSIEHDENHPGTWSSEEARNSQALREQYSERGHQVDENEAVAKGQYESNHCENVTGLSSNNYRDKVIEDYTHEQMEGNPAMEIQGDDYWSESIKNENGAENKDIGQSEQADYWTENTVSNSTAVADANEQENAIENEVSC